jgi:pyruvate dehydrogenase (quinone)
MSRTAGDLLVERLIDFAAVASACGAGCFRVDDPAQVESVLEEAFAHPGPALVEAAVDANEPSMPGHVTMDQAWHFAKSLVRGEKDRMEIIKNVLKQTVREVV